MFLFTTWHLNSSPFVLCPMHAQIFFRGVALDKKKIMKCAKAGLK
jgi:hypothetical protein